MERRPQREELVRLWKTSFLLRQGEALVEGMRALSRELIGATIAVYICMAFCFSPPTTVSVLHALTPCDTLAKGFQRHAVAREPEDRSCHHSDLTDEGHAAARGHSPSRPRLRVAFQPLGFYPQRCTHELFPRLEG